MRHLGVILAGVLLAGCAASVSKQAHSIDIPDLERLESSSSYHHLSYLGSDQDFHYFCHFRCGKILMYETYYKVERYRLKLDRTFGLSEDDAYVVWPGTIAKAAAAIAEGATPPSERESKAKGPKTK